MGAKVANSGPFAIARVPLCATTPPKRRPRRGFLPYFAPRTERKFGTLNKQHLQQHLHEHHENFLRLLGSIPDEAFFRSVETGKWSPAQQLDHIHKSTGAFNMALLLPKLMWKGFGTAKRPSRPYDVLVADYQTCLAEGGKSSVKFNPADVKPHQRGVLTAELRTIVDNMCKRIGKLSEKELDRYRLPHPLLGKLTLREMSEFTIYHVQHHQRQVEAAVREN